MNKKIFFGRSIKDIFFAIGPSLLLFVIVVVIAHKYLDPAPPNHVVITTGEDEGDYQNIAKEYQEILKKDGVNLEIRPSAGPLENLKLLEDDDADVDIGFVQDGLGSPSDQPDLVSLGSLYYEPVWIFYRGTAELNRISQLKGKKIAIGHQGRGTHLIAMRLLQINGIDRSNTSMVDNGGEAAVEALQKGQLDAAFFILTPEDPMIEKMMADPTLRLMNMDQAEAITRQIPSLHHLVLPHGTFNLQKNIPNQDIHLVSPTATLLIRDDLHPALIYLLLKAASEVHSDASIFEKKNEFPINKDDQFPMSRDAQQFYKSGGPFWQRYLPFWLAALVDRFLLVVIPILALLLPLIRLIPRIYQWRIRSRIYRRYGELKFLETQIKNEMKSQELKNYLKQLDVIEDRVNGMKVPLDFSEHIYSLRGHIHFVRERLQRQEITG